MYSFEYIAGFIRIAYTRIQDGECLVDILTHSPETLSHQYLAEVYGPTGSHPIPMWWCSI